MPFRENLATHDLGILAPRGVNNADALGGGPFPKVAQRLISVVSG
jgi:hypothetical protein